MYNFAKDGAFKRKYILSNINGFAGSVKGDFDSHYLTLFIWSLNLNLTGWSLLLPESHEKISWLWNAFCNCNDIAVSTHLTCDSSTSPGYYQYTWLFAKSRAINMCKAYLSVSRLFWLCKESSTNFAAILSCNDAAHDCRILERPVLSFPLGWTTSTTTWILFQMLVFLEFTMIT